MGLVSHGVAGGIGCYIAQPNGQRRLTQLRRRVVGPVRPGQNPASSPATDPGELSAPSLVRGGHERPDL